MTPGIVTELVLGEVGRERRAQDEKWGEQNHPDGTRPAWSAIADGMRARADLHARAGSLTWRDIFEEELWEAYAETDQALLRAELVQVAAVAVAWIESIDRRPGKGSSACTS